MRVRITKQPPLSYGVDTASLLPGRVYNLDSALASALLADGCAELYDTLTSHERKFHYDAHRAQLWEAADRKRARAWGNGLPTDGPPAGSSDPTEA